ncbi:hypothetical protein, partial [Pseudarthrobacter sp. efr-133-R2A-89]|uniref:hypothetical protein n=1 Tax=Pseudarthrobacter sp. efr-133-R2A-89 TaxID=3040302 RepID=UPI0025523AA0
SLRSNFPNLPDPPPQHKSNFQDPNRKEDRPHTDFQRPEGNQILALIWGFWPPGDQFFTVSPAAT